jgi:hypothetical protein
VPGMNEPQFPLTRTSNGGRQITIERSEDDDNALAFRFEGTEVAKLQPPDNSAPVRTDGMLEWPLRFESYPDTTVLGRPDDPPITDALFYVDLALDSLDDD